MAGVTNREFWDFRVKTRAQFTKLAEQIANIDTSGGGGISELTSKMVVDALGYTPYNANNPANYITSDALSPYAKTADVSTTYATIASVSTLQTTVSNQAETILANEQGLEELRTTVGDLGDAIPTNNNQLTNGAGYITSDALSPYAKISQIPTTVSQLTDSGDYLKKTSAETTYAKIASIQGFENRIGGLEGAVPQLNERVTTVEGKVSSLNETVSTGENNLLDRVNVIEEEYATKTYVDNAIGGIDLSPYLKTEDAKETYATKDFVNNKLVNYATIVSVTAIQNTLTGQIGAVNARVEQLASTKLDSSYFTLTNIKSTLGISDWALAATKPSYAWSEITSRPTALSQFTDDVVAGKYLPLSGGTIRNDSNATPLTIASSAQAYTGMSFINKNNERGYFIYAGGSDYGVTAAGWSATYTLLHSGNIGNYEAGSSVWSKCLDRITSIPASSHCVYFYSGQPTLGDDINNAKEGSNAYHLWSYPVHGTYVSGGKANIMNLRLQWNKAYLHDIFVSPNYDDVWHRSILDGICNPWRKFAFTDSNVASATKLQKRRTLWGQSFDGTEDVTHGFRSLCPNSYNGGVAHSILNNSGAPYGLITRIYGNGNVSLQAQREDDNSECFGLLLNPLGGNVGIGTTSPTERLDVGGNIKASGNINATSITINGVTITASNGSITVNGNVFATGDITGGV